jgi:hypothetical protein
VLHVEMRMVVLPMSIRIAQGQVHQFPRLQVPHDKHRSTFVHDSKSGWAAAVAA